MKPNLSKNYREYFLNSKQKLVITLAKVTTYN